MSCVLKSDGGGEKQKRKASVVFSVGSNFCKVLQGNLEVRKKPVSLCFSSLIMSVLIKNLKGTRNDYYSLRIYSRIVVQCNGWL